MDFLNAIWAAVEPVFLEALAALVAAAVARLALIIDRKLGIQMEEAHRAALEQAIMSAVSSLPDKMSVDQAVQDVEDYVRESVPDAIGKLKPTPKVLSKKIIASLRNAGEFIETN